MEWFLYYVTIAGFSICLVFPFILLLWFAFNGLVYLLHRALRDDDAKVPCCDLSHQHASGRCTGKISSAIPYPNTKLISVGPTQTTPLNADYSTTSMVGNQLVTSYWKKGYSYSDPDFKPSKYTATPCPCDKPNYTSDGKWTREWDYVRCECMVDTMKYLLVDLVGFILFMVMFIALQFDIQVVGWAEILVTSIYIVLLFGITGLFFMRIFLLFQCK